MKNLTLTKFNLETGHVSAYGDQLMNVPPPESVLISSWHSVIDDEKGLLYISCTLNPEAKPSDSKTTFFSMDIHSGKTTLSKPISFPIMFLQFGLVIHNTYIACACLFDVNVDERGCFGLLEYKFNLMI